MLAFDHIAIATTDLAQGTNEVGAALGVPLQQGGKHAAFGTHNTLLSLGDLYLEVIAKDPSAPAINRPTWFNLDHFSGPTRPANWICRTPAFDKLPDFVGTPIPLERDGLRWTFAVPDDGSLPRDGAYPSVMKWDDGITPPAGSLPDQGCRLISWIIIHPDAATLALQVPVTDNRVQFETGPAPAFRAIIQTPSGTVTL